MRLHNRGPAHVHRGLPLRSTSPNARRCYGGASLRPHDPGAYFTSNSPTGLVFYTNTRNLLAIFLAFAFVMYSLFRSNVRPAIASIISVALATLYVVACGIVHTYAPDKNPYFIFNLWFILIPVSGVFANVHVEV
jgi:hypothetical protein